MKELKVKVTICSPTARDSKLVVEDVYDVAVDTVEDRWDIICNELEVYSRLFALPRIYTFVEFSFDILVENKHIELTIGKPVETPLGLIDYKEVKGLCDTIKESM